MLTHVWRRLSLKALVDIHVLHVVWIDTSTVMYDHCVCGPIHCCPPPSLCVSQNLCSAVTYVLFKNRCHIVPLTYPSKWLTVPHDIVWFAMNSGHASDNTLIAKTIIHLLVIVMRKPIMRPGVVILTFITLWIVLIMIVSTIITTSTHYTLYHHTVITSNITQQRAHPPSRLHSRPPTMCWVGLHD